MNISPILQKLFPQGSVGPGSGNYQGECISFCHEIVDFGTMGDSFSKKKQFVQQYGITAPNIAEVARGFRIGDLVVTSDGTFLGFGAGHGFIVADQDANYLYAAESNFRLSKRVDYGRKVAKNDSKIYGLCRFPMKVKIADTVQLKVSMFMNFAKQWDPKILDQAVSLFNAYTGGKITINPFGLYTSFKDWTYEYTPNPFTGETYKNMAKSYFDQDVMPMQFYSNAVVLCVDPADWQGTILGTQNTPELAWYFPNTNPAQIVIAANETDKSPWYDMPLYVHAFLHELDHWLKFVNGGNDDTHLVDNQQRRVDLLYQGLDFNRVMANL